MNYLLCCFVLLVCFISSCKEQNFLIISDPDYTDIEAKNIVDTISLSGTKSVYLDSIDIYGLSKRIKNPKLNEVYEVSVFKKGNNALVKLAANTQNGFYTDANWVFNTLNGWSELKLRVIITEKIANQDLTFFAYNPSGQNVFIDSLSIQKIDISNEELLPDYVFYPVFYAISKRYLLDHFTTLKSENTKLFFQEIDQSYFNSHSLDRTSFIKTYDSLMTKIGFEEIVKKTIAYKATTKHHQVSFVKEDDMEIKKLDAYTKQVIYDINDKIKIEIKNIENQKYDVNISKIISRKIFKPVKTYSKLQGNTLSISAKDIGTGFFDVTLRNDIDTFRLNIIVSDYKDNELIVLAPFTTWQAYNTYGGKSLYKNGIDQFNVDSIYTQKPLNCLNYDEVLCNLFTLKNIYDWFSQYNATIYPDYFLEAYPSLFDQCKTLVLAQHAEYFSPFMYQKLKNIERNTNLIFFGGNQMYWKVLWNNDFTSFECQKDGTYFRNTSIPGGLWRDAFTSEASLQGVGYTNAGYKTYAPYRVENENHFLFNGLNLEKGDLFGQKGILGEAICGDETDKRIQGARENSVLLAKGENPKNGGGELVFIDREGYATLSTGAITSGNGLFIDSVLSKLMSNFMDKYHNK